MSEIAMLAKLKELEDIVDQAISGGLCRPIAWLNALTAIKAKCTSTAREIEDGLEAMAAAMQDEDGPPA